MERNIHVTDQKIIIYIYIIFRIISLQMSHVSIYINKLLEGSIFLQQKKYNFSNLLDHIGVLGHSTMNTAIH